MKAFKILNRFQTCFFFIFSPLAHKMQFQICNDTGIYISHT